MKESRSAAALAESPAGASSGWAIEQYVHISLPRPRLPTRDETAAQTERRPSTGNLAPKSSRSKALSGAVPPPGCGGGKSARWMKESRSAAALAESPAGASSGGKGKGKARTHDSLQDDDDILFVDPEEDKKHSPDPVVEAGRVRAG
jgi:hypothetical protein